MGEKIDTKSPIMAPTDLNRTLTHNSGGRIRSGSVVNDSLSNFDGMDEIQSVAWD